MASRFDLAVSRDVPYSVQNLIPGTALPEMSQATMALFESVDDATPPLLSTHPWAAAVSSTSNLELDHPLAASLSPPVHPVLSSLSSYAHKLSWPPSPSLALSTMPSFVSRARKLLKDRLPDWMVGTRDHRDRKVTDWLEKVPTAFPMTQVSAAAPRPGRSHDRSARPLGLISFCCHQSRFRIVDGVA